jgi:anaerobic ribonucleoside-triphosphate reductase activating protein
MRYHDITKDDMKNGDGLRVVLWMSGCSHHCPDCQNPVTWDPMYIGNRNDTLILCRYIKRVFPKKTIWMYTGYWYDDIKDHEIMKYVDVLVDGTFVKALKDNTLKWRGSSNQRVINVPESRQMDKICLLCD